MVANPDTASALTWQLRSPEEQLRPHGVQLFPDNWRLQPLPLLESRRLPACGFLLSPGTLVSLLQSKGCFPLGGYMRFGKQSVGITSVNGRETALCKWKGMKEVIFNATGKA